MTGPTTGEVTGETRYALEFRTDSYFVNVDRENGGTIDEALTFNSEKHANWWFSKFAPWVWMNGGMIVPVNVTENARHKEAGRG